MRSLFIRCLVIVALSLVLVTPGCSSPGGTTTSLDTGEVTGTPTTAPGSSDPGEVVLAVAAAPFEHLDPASASSSGDVFLTHQIYDRLVEVDATGALRPGLALSWEESASTGWTFTLRPDVVFHDGGPFDSEDVVYTFERLARVAREDPRTAGGLAAFASIRSVVALTPERVLFVLAAHDPEFPQAVAEDAAALLSSDTVDPEREWVGTGPFVLWSYVPGSGAVLKRNPAYWARDAGGRLLPYLDGVDIVFESDPGAALEDLQTGRVGLAGGLDGVQARTAEAAEGVSLVESPSNEHLAILLRAEPGSPLADERVRRALKAATDRSELAAAVRLGFTSPGNDSPVGPLYGALHLGWSPSVDVEGAAALLVEAGYPEGFALDLSVGNDPEAAVIAEVWGVQMQAIGVDVTVSESGPAGGSGEGGGDLQRGAAEVARFFTAVSPRTYLTQTYRVGTETGALWDDEEFAGVLQDLADAEDQAARVDAYYAAQKILRDRGPVIVPFYESSLEGADERLTGLDGAAWWPRTSLRAVSFGG